MKSKNVLPLERVCKDEWLRLPFFLVPLLFTSLLIHPLSMLFHLPLAIGIGCITRLILTRGTARPGEWSFCCCSSSLMLQLPLSGSIARSRNIKGQEHSFCKTSCRDMGLSRSPTQPIRDIILEIKWMAHWCAARLDKALPHQLTIPFADSLCNKIRTILR